jgi:putative membrane-bound dehydrogenase-like protein
MNEMPALRPLQFLNSRWAARILSSLPSLQAAQATSLSILCAFLSCAPALDAAEPTLSSNDLPRFPAHEPSEALKTFKIKPGFHLEIPASEPNIASPVAVCFDENNRMFVVEMIDYSERREEMPHLGRIRMLEDTDGDGVYDKSTVFADNLPWPTAIVYYNGGIFVGATPDILYLKDTNGDGKADTREIVFTGFSEGVKRINVQAMLNSFNWGLDNRIHGATSGNGGVVKMLKHPEAKPLDLHGRDFVIEPRSLTMTSEAGGGQHGLSFDDFGHRFACNNSDHIRFYIYDDRYAARNPFYAMPACIQSIAVDGPAAEVYRISPEEPWRVIRTKWRVSGLVGGPIEGGGRASGYFTGATGTTIYRGNAFPKEYLDNAFVGDAGGNLVHRKVILPDGVNFKAQRGPDEETVEFAASTDTWFRPVQFANTPDGTLFVIDMYREVIEHPWSLPDNIKKFLDLNSGNNRGRIYRIAPDGFKQPKPPRLGNASIKELVATLEHPNGWHRDTASRLIYERQDKAAVSPLVELIKHSKFPLARLHALHSLEGLGSLDEEHVLIALNDSDANVREHAIKLCENLFYQGEKPAESSRPSQNPRFRLVVGSAEPSAKLLSRLQALASDPDIHVRYQLAFTLGEIKGPAKIGPLAAIAKKDLDSSWTQAAILSSLAEGAGDLFANLSADSRFCDSKLGQEFLRRLVMLVGAKNQPEEVGRVVDFIGKVNQPAVSFALVRGLGDGLQRAGSSLAGVGGNVKTVLASASKTAEDGKTPEATRLQAVQVLGLTSFAGSGKSLLALLNLQQPQAIQLAAIATLARFNDNEVGVELTKHWDMLTPRLRSEAVTVLLARKDRALALLEAIQSGAIRASALDTTQAKFLRNHHDQAVRQLAVKVLGAKPSGNRQQVVEQFMPALNLKGEVAHGKKIYQERCVLCHRLGGEGSAVGPDLVTVKNTGREKIMVNILDPNREVRPDYVSYLVETKDEESQIGLVVNETATTVTLRQPYGKESIVNRSDIKKMQSQGQSLMPEGLEAGLSAQDLADLIAYIETADDKLK